MMNNGGSSNLFSGCFEHESIRIGGTNKQNLMQQQQQQQSSSSPPSSSSPSLCHGVCGSSKQQQQQQGGLLFPSAVASTATGGGKQGKGSDEVIDPIGSRELGLLTPQQRERVFDEIHGVCDVLDETSEEFISQCLFELEYEIIKIRDKSAYTKALFLAPSRIKNPKFRIMFLRSTGYDIPLAAKKIVKHFEYKAELFGINKVAQKITLSDLDENDMIALQAGALQFLPCTDRAGRSVVFTARYYSNYKTWQNEIRTAWYSAMVALEEEGDHDDNNPSNQIQKNGTVVVCYTMDCPENKKKSSRDILTKFYMLRDGLPLRRNAIHFCYNNMAMKSAMIVFRTIAGPEFRMRFRDHYGSFQEIQYQLMTFGIDPKIFPLDDKGILRKNCMKEYIEKRLQKEAKEKEVDATSTIIYAPTSNDVLLGRGKPFQGHTGNLQLVKYLEQRWEEYMKSDRFQKTILSWEMVKMIQSECHGRFLEKDEFTDMWRIVSDDVAREKCASGFRSMKKNVVAARSSGGSNRPGGGRGDDVDSSLATMTIDSKKRMKHPNHHNFTMM